MQFESAYRRLEITQRWASSQIQTVRLLYEACKPGIVGMTLVAALAGAYVANGSLLPLELVVWLFFTLGPVTAGACMLNNVYDRDIDRLMARTSKRELASGALSARLGLYVGLTLTLLPLPLMAVTVNAAAALLTAGAAFGYVVVYTMLAKRRTSWANQLGGIAGALPPVIGVVAVSSGFDIRAGVLFAIMVLWQQPHALSLALKYRDDYARAGVPVVPVVKGVFATKVRIFIYALILLPVSTLPYFIGMTGLLYLAVAATLSAVFVQKAFNFLRSSADCDMRLFLFSLTHLVGLFAVLMLDGKPWVH
ncbi:MAG: heme o synthase [Burkholderiales bacterium]